MSEDHKPDRPSERERIVEAGGSVSIVGCARVNGVLATSRGFGDKDLKKWCVSVCGRLCRISVRSFHDCQNERYMYVSLGAVVGLLSVSRGFQDEDVMEWGVCVCVFHVSVSVSCFVRSDLFSCDRALHMHLGTVCSAHVARWDLVSNTCEILRGLSDFVFAVALAVP